MSKGLKTALIITGTVGVIATGIVVGFKYLEVACNRSLKGVFDSLDDAFEELEGA